MTTGRLKSLRLFSTLPQNLLVMSVMAMFCQVQNANTAGVPEALDWKGRWVWHSFEREWAGSDNTTPASTQQRFNDGFDMNHRRVEKLDACVTGVAQ
jgi:hypothetical protein